MRELMSRLWSQREVYANPSLHLLAVCPQEGLLASLRLQFPHLLNGDKMLPPGGVGS